MGKTDNVTVAYMRQNATFADAFNYLLYGGEQVIKPEDLQERDTREMTLLFGSESKRSVDVQRIRDLIKYAVIKEDAEATYMALAMECQTDIHYAMPVRDMVCDGLHYAGQVDALAKKNRAAAKMTASVASTTSGAEAPTAAPSGTTATTTKLDNKHYLSGLLPGDKLKPVITLVVYFGNEPWDGPTSLHEMFDTKNETVLSFVPDYRINLIDPMGMSDEDFERFHTNLRGLFKFIHYSSSEEDIRKIEEDDDSLKKLGYDEINVLNHCIHAKIELNDDKEVPNMCKGLEDMRMHAKEDGIALGRAEGRAEGRVEGLATGAITAKISFVDNLMAKLKSSLEEACSLAEISVEEYKANKGLASTL